MNETSGAAMIGAFVPRRMQGDGAVTLLTLDDHERRELANLIGEYQTLLESTVDALIVPGTNEAMPGQVEDARQLKRARRMNAACERWQKRLESEGSTDAD